MILAHVRWMMALLVLGLTAPAPAQDSVVVLRGATVETMGSAGRVENATVVIRGDKIESVGAEVQVPDGARVIDATGMTIMPGIVDPYYVVRIQTSAQAPTEERTIVIRGRTFRGRSRGTVTTGSFTRIAENFYPYETNFRPLMRSGITTANLVAAGQGQAAIARITPADLPSMVVEPEGRLYATVTNQTSSLDVLRNGLAGRASRGGSGRGGGRSGFRGGRGGGRGFRGAPPTTSRSSSAPAIDTTAEWRKVKEGKAPVIVNLDNAAAILHTLKLLEGYPSAQVAVISSGSNLYQTLDEFDASRTTLVLRPTLDEEPYSQKQICLPRMAHEAGINFVFSLALSSPTLVSSQDDPLFGVAYMVKSGVPRQAALEALTIRPAKLLGIDKAYGSLEAGKQANLLVFEGDPLEAGSALRQVFVDGSRIHEN